MKNTFNRVEMYRIEIKKIQIKNYKSLFLYGINYDFIFSFIHVIIFKL